VTVKHWTSPNDANHSNRHAEADGIEFFAFPYQNYLARLSDHIAIVADTLQLREIEGAKKLVTRWSASIRLCHSNGHTTLANWCSFDTEDEAFEWAAKQLIELGKPAPPPVTSM